MTTTSSNLWSRFGSDPLAQFTNRHLSFKVHCSPNEAILCIYLIWSSKYGMKLINPSNGMKNIDAISTKCKLPHKWFQLYNSFAIGATLQKCQSHRWISHLQFSRSTRFVRIICCVHIPYTYAPCQKRVFDYFSVWFTQLIEIGSCGGWDLTQKHPKVSNLKTWIYYGRTIARIIRFHYFSTTNLNLLLNDDTQLTPYWL